MTSAFAEAEGPHVRPVADSEPGWISKMLWYVPNRVMDLMDVFRLRVKVGPGLGVGARFTDAFSFYGGEQYTAYVGLPGPRQQAVFPGIAGYEQKKGLVILGLDASDDMPNPPHYEFSEIGASAHLLFVGVDAGVSLVEFKDFVDGWFGLDASGDDFPRREKPPPLPGGGVLRPLPPDFLFPVEKKPESFNRIHDRLDYLEKNVPPLLRGQMRNLDWSLTDPAMIVEEQPPVTNLRLSLFVETITGPDATVSVDPDIKIRVELPNFENSLSVFIQSSYDEDLPGTDIDQRDDKGWSFGARRQMEKWNISTDVGIHTKWPPELFARTAWKPQWQISDWNCGFEFRLFWENEDGFGIYNQLQAFHWLGEQDRWIFRSLTAGKYSESTKGYEWQQTGNMAYIFKLKDEKRRRGNVGVNDILDGASLNLTVFGSDEVMDKYRSTVTCRKSIYRDFVVIQFEPGLEWSDEHDWTTQYRLDAGMVLLF
ncbi:hypothetical protein P0Y35_07750 [Kiritimatiellaeota bacterium B1221]|nr:hypothetical protein [Kiritimatiellaeota bacterium B1221]